MPHYYENDANLPSKPRELHINVRGRVYPFVVDDGVFSKRQLDHGSQLLIETLLTKELGGSLLDMGCGYGPIGIILALNHPNLKVTMVDVNIRAVQLAQKNIVAHKLTTRVEALTGDTYQPIHETFDTIVSNPPIRAGKKVIYQIYEEAKHHLSENGRLYIVIRKNQGAATSYEFLKTHYRHVTRIERHEGYHIYEAHD